MTLAQSTGGRHEESWARGGLFWEGGPYGLQEGDDPERLPNNGCPARVGSLARVIVLDATTAENGTKAGPNLSHDAEDGVAVRVGQHQVEDHQPNFIHASPKDLQGGASVGRRQDGEPTVLKEGAHDLPYP